MPGLYFRWLIGPVPLSAKRQTDIFQDFKRFGAPFALT